MKPLRWASGLKSGLARGIFPHELSFFLDLPWRNVCLSPRKLAGRLGLEETSRVLEVGCGPGFYSAEVARRVPRGRLELLDLQPEMLAKARRKLEAKGLGANVGYTTADARGLPFESESFDVLFLVAVLGEVSDRKAFLGEARRILKHGGVLSVSEHLPDPDFSSFAKVRGLIETEGFRCFERRGPAWCYTANFRKSGPTP
ncbi:MAG TPA: class I SAM-dependent methyltransferase [Pyrinomonadaceae bacterium]|nr:class I SAM-dependent methyltransferase [Pyrinomonadaceae bacterium]